MTAHPSLGDGWRLAGTPRMALVVARWAETLEADAVGDHHSWVLAVGRADAPPAVVADRLLALAPSEATLEHALDLLHTAWRESRSGSEGPAEEWPWLERVRGAVAYAVDRLPLRSGSLGVGPLAASIDRRDAPTCEGLISLLVSVARGPTGCDGLCFVTEGGVGRRREVVGDELPDPHWLDAVDYTGAMAQRSKDMDVTRVSVSDHQRRIGSLVAWRSGRPFRMQERAAMRALAAEAGIAIESSTLAARWRGAAGALQVLYKVSCQLQTSLDLSAVLEEVCASFCQVGGAARAAILEVAEDGALRGLAARGVDTEVVRTLAAVGLNSTLTLHAIEQGRPVVHQPDRLRGEIAEAALMAAGVDGALACVPLLAGGDLLGVVFFDRDGSEFVLEDDEAEQCMTVGNLAALALQRARLYTAAQDLARQEERGRIGEELHDLVVQSLFRAGLELRRLAETWPEVAGELDEVRALTSSAATRLREAITHSASKSIDATLMEDRLRALAAGFASRTATTCDMSTALPGEPDASLATLLERCVSECLNNVEKHAGGAYAAVKVAYRRGWVVATVDDAGPGLTTTGDLRKRTAFGLASLKSQARNRGGRLAVGSSPLGGVRVELRVPWIVSPSPRDPAS